jgi:hypothetical protein
MFDYDASPYEVEHSLIQKAVRRGNVELVEKVFAYIFNKGQKKWLQDRLAVMAYEECWTYANELDYSAKNPKLLQQYKSLATTIKNKNADGLADLAIKLHKGKDVSNVGGEKEQKAIKSVSNAIDNQDKFWDWIKDQDEYKKNKQRIDAAERDITRAVYDNDKVMMLAAAYLTVRYPVPKTQFTNPNNDPNFPYWIAIDKHTSIGKQIYSVACAKIKLNYDHGKKLGFYLEGGNVNQIMDSPFWGHIKDWQLKEMCYTLTKAQKDWHKLSQELRSMPWFKAEVQDTINKINAKKKSNQLGLGLFD